MIGRCYTVRLTVREGATSPILLVPVCAKSPGHAVALAVLQLSRDGVINLPTGVYDVDVEDWKCPNTKE